GRLDFAERLPERRHLHVGEEPLARLLALPGDMLGGVLLDEAPLLREREHAPQQSPRAVRLVAAGHRALVLRLALGGARAHAAQERLDIALPHLVEAPGAQSRDDVVLQHALVLGTRAGLLRREVSRAVEVGQLRPRDRLRARARVLAAPRLREPL